MINFDYIHLSENKTPEENIKELRSYLCDLADALNLLADNVEELQQNMKERTDK